MRIEPPARVRFASVLPMHDGCRAKVDDGGLGGICSTVPRDFGVPMYRTKTRGPLWALMTGGLVGAAALLYPQTASALNGGVEYGVVKRNADDPHNFKLGTGWGAHLELSLLPILNVGPYYLHYELAPSGRGASATHDGAFDALGLRARFFIPLPDSNWRPYAYAGIGYTAVRYPSFELPFDVNNPAMRTGGFEARRGYFFETPVGLGVAYEVIRILHLSADFAMRPGFGFGGAAYDDVSAYSEPKWGYSILLGAAVDL